MQERFSKQKKLVFLAKKRFIEIGSPQSYEQAKKYFRKHEISSYKNIFLDRDGIINEIIMRDGVVSSPRSYKEFLYRDDSLEFSKK